MKTIVFAIAAVCGTSMSVMAQTEETPKSRITSIQMNFQGSFANNNFTVNQLYEQADLASLVDQNTFAKTRRFFGNSQAGGFAGVGFMPFKKHKNGELMFGVSMGASNGSYFRADVEDTLSYKPAYVSTASNDTVYEYVYRNHIHSLDEVSSYANITLQYMYRAFSENIFSLQFGGGLILGTQINRRINYLYRTEDYSRLSDRRTDRYNSYNESTYQEYSVKASPAHYIRPFVSLSMDAALGGNPDKIWNHIRPFLEGRMGFNEVFTKGSTAQSLFGGLAMGIRYRL